MRNLYNTLVEFMKADCKKCEHDKTICEKMYKKEKETLCVMAHKAVTKKINEYKPDSYKEYPNESI